MGRRPAVRLAALLAVGLLAACQATPPMAAERLALTEEDLTHPQGSLSPSQQRDARDALRALAQPHLASPPPVQAGDRGRWSDVPNAASAAAAAREMAIFKTVQTLDSFEFELRTVNNRPARLVVHRRDDPEVYFATATVGRRTLDEPAGRALLLSFEEFMQRFGRKRKFDD